MNRIVAVLNFYLYSPKLQLMTASTGQKNALPREADAHRQGEQQRMLGAVGLDAATRWQEVLQAGLGEEANAGCQVILQAQTDGS